MASLVEKSPTIAVHFTSLHFTSLHFTSLHFTSLHSSLFLFNGVSHLIPFRRQITFIVFIPDNFN